MKAWTLVDEPVEDEPQITLRHLSWM